MFEESLRHRENTSSQALGAELPRLELQHSIGRRSHHYIYLLCMTRIRNSNNFDKSMQLLNILTDINLNQ